MYAKAMSGAGHPGDVRLARTEVERRSGIELGTADMI